MQIIQREIILFYLIFLCKSNSVCKLFTSVYLYTDVYIAQGMREGEKSFIIRRATTKMNEIQSWHFCQLVQDSILSWCFYPLMTCHHCSCKTDNENDLLWENGLNMCSPYLHIPCISEAFEMLDFLSLSF